VNGLKVDIPSYQVKANDVITVKQGSSAEPIIRAATELVASVAPWLQADYDALNGKVLKAPERSEIDTPVSEQLIVEYYSK
jgi:small subunit ribosomal protein S4